MFIASYPVLAAETVTGSGGATYAYVYSTSDGSFTGDAGGSTFTAGGVTSTLSDFSQLYAVGTSDGTDSMTLHSEGGCIRRHAQLQLRGGHLERRVVPDRRVVCRQCHHPGHECQGFRVLLQLRRRHVQRRSGRDALSGSATGFANFATFATQASGFQSVTVEESGSGTDVANLTSPGSGTFTAMPTVSSLAVGGVSIITVNTYFSTGGQFVAVPSKVNITGNSNGSDTAFVYDAAGTNTLVAQGNTATLTTPVNTVVVTQFGKVQAIKQSGTSDTVHQQSIDFALSTVGNWTSD